MGTVNRLSLMIDKQSSFFRPLLMVKHLTGHYPLINLQLSYLTDTCFIGPVMFRLPIVMETERYAVCVKDTGPYVIGVRSIFWNIVFPVWNPETSSQEYHSTAQSIACYPHIPRMDILQKNKG
jgi:hypothetical protein